MNKPPSSSTLPLLIAASLLAGSVFSSADPVVWSATGNSSWQDPANWSGGILPAAGDVVEFAQQSRRTIALDGPAYGDHFNFKNYNWVLNSGTGGMWHIGSSVSLEDNLTVNGNLINIGERDVVFNIPSDFTLNGRFSMDPESGTVTINGGGRLLSEIRSEYTGGRSGPHSFTVNDGGTLQFSLWDGGIQQVAGNNVAVVLGDDATLRLTGNRGPLIDVSGTGNVSVAGAVHLNGGSNYTFDGNVLVTGNGTMGSGLVDFSTIGGDFHVLNLATVTLLSGTNALHVNGLMGDAGTTVQSTQADRTLKLGFNDHDGAYTGTLSSRLRIVKTGAGVQSFSGTNTYTGTTVVEGGKLLIDGVHEGNGNFSTTGTGVLGGTGLLKNTTTFSGTLMPGDRDGLGRLSVDSIEFTGDSILKMQINGADAESHGQLYSDTGAIQLDGSVGLAVEDSAFANPGGESVVIVKSEAAGSVSGGFQGLSEGSTVPGTLGQWVVSYVGGDGDDVSLFFPNLQANPAPTGVVTKDSAAFSLGVFTGTGTVSATLFYGLTDGGETPENWDASASLGSGLASGTHATMVSGLASDTRYFYAYRVVHEGGETIWATSETSEFNTLLDGQSAPANLTAIGDWDEVTVTWEDGYTHENGFILERSTTADFSADVVTWSLDADTTQYVDTETENNVVYYYRVAAVDAADQPTQWSTSADAAAPASAVLVSEYTLSESSVFDLNVATQKKALRGTRTAGGAAQINWKNVSNGSNNPIVDYGVPTDSTWYDDVFGSGLAVTKFRESYNYPFDFGNGVQRDLPIVPVYLHNEEGGSWNNNILIDLAFTGTVEIAGTTYTVEVVQGASKLFDYRMTSYPGYFDDDRVSVFLYEEGSDEPLTQTGRYKKLDGEWYRFTSNPSGEQLSIHRVVATGTIAIDTGEFASPDFAFLNGFFYRMEDAETPLDLGRLTQPGLELGELDFVDGKAVVPAGTYRFNKFTVENGGYRFQFIWHYSAINGVPQGQFEVASDTENTLAFGQEAEVAYRIYYEEDRGQRHGLFDSLNTQAFTFDKHLQAAIVPLEPSNYLLLDGMWNGAGDPVYWQATTHGCGWNGAYDFYTSHKYDGRSNFTLSRDMDPPAVNDTRTVRISANMQGLYGPVSAELDVDVKNEVFGIRAKYFDFDAPLYGYPDYTRLPDLERIETSMTDMWSSLPASMSENFAAVYEFEQKIDWFQSGGNAENGRLNLRLRGAARVYLDGELVAEHVSHDQEKLFETWLGDVEPKIYSVRIEYYNREGAAHLSGYWSIFKGPYHFGMNMDPANPGATAHVAAVVPTAFELAQPSGPVELTTPASLDLSITATHPDGAPTLAYYVDGELVAEDSASPYTRTLSGLPVGGQVDVRVVDPFGFGVHMPIACTITREAEADWMQRHGLTEADGDDDGDGLTNIEEYQAGTDPNDANSTFVVKSLEEDLSGDWLSWRGVTDDTIIRHYQVQRSYDLKTWESYGEPVRPNATGVMHAPVSRPEGAGGLFYRVLSVPR